MAMGKHWVTLGWTGDPQDGHGGPGIGHGVPGDGRTDVGTDTGYVGTDMGDTGMDTGMAGQTWGMHRMDIGDQGTVGWTQGPGIGPGEPRMAGQMWGPPGRSWGTCGPPRAGGTDPGLFGAPRARTPMGSGCPGEG